MAAPPAAKWKSEKPIAPKRETPGTLEPLDYKPTPKEDIDTIQISKQKATRDGSKYIKPRPVLLESLGPPSQARTTAIGTGEHNMIGNSGDIVNA